MPKFKIKETFLKKKIQSLKNIIQTQNQWVSLHYAPPLPRLHPTLPLSRPLYSSLQHSLESQQIWNTDFFFGNQADLSKLKIQAPTFTGRQI